MGTNFCVYLNAYQRTTILYMYIVDVETIIKIVTNSTKYT